MLIVINYRDEWLWETYKLVIKIRTTVGDVFYFHGIYGGMLRAHTKYRDVRECLHSDTLVWCFIIQNATISLLLFPEKLLRTFRDFSWSLSIRSELAGIVKALEKTKSYMANERFCIHMKN